MTITERNNAAARIPLSRCVQLACELEVWAKKPGNVYEGNEFADTTVTDFYKSAAAISPILGEATRRRLGETVLDCVQATRAVVEGNTNLGIILLLAPLAKTSGEIPLEEGVSEVLRSLDRDDARHVYEAIRLARPGGLGQVEKADIFDSPPDDLIEAMRLAAPRDLVARQYANGFDDVFRSLAPDLGEGVRRGWPLADTIVWTHVRQLRRDPDSLIARKCGSKIAREASQRAASVLTTGQPGDHRYVQALADLDSWLRADGHRRNPGTTADLVCAGLFVCLWNGIVQCPPEFC